MYQRYSWPIRARARFAVAEYIEVFYNRRRLHSSLDYRTPFEALTDLAGAHAPDHAASLDDPIIIDLDATLLTAHSDKEQAAATFKRGFGFHPLLSFLDHGQHGTGEPLSFLLRRGNAGSNTAADHITVARAAFAQLPGHQPGQRPGKRVLVRTDGAGCTHEFLDWLAGQRVQSRSGSPCPATSLLR